MAYPGEPEHVRYLDYVEKVSLGELPGPMLTKAKWRETQKQIKKSGTILTGDNDGSAQQEISNE